jgi:hypothetical protein
LTGGIGIKACKLTIRSALLFIAQHFTKATHVFIAVNIAEQVEQKQGWRIITRGAFIRITVGHQRADKAKIDHRGDHAAHATFNIAVWQDFDKSFFKSVLGKPVQVGERLLMGNGNIYIDFVELFGYAGDGEFFKGVHNIPFDPGGSWRFRSDYPISFFLKPLVSGYTNTSFIFPWSR